MFMDCCLTYPAELVLFLFITLKLTARMGGMMEKQHLEAMLDCRKCNV